MHTPRSVVLVSFTAALLAAACEDGGARRAAAELNADALEPGPTRSMTNDPSRHREGDVRRGFVQNIESMTEANDDFRRVLYTGRHTQLVLMAVPAGDHIGVESHDVDQFFRVETGDGEVVIDGARTPIGPGSGIIVPARATHDVVNKGTSPLKLYTLYSPPQHRDGVVHRTRLDAARDTEQFDGRTTE